jgi:calcineurin-like phosphoesterase family protein
MIYYIADIHFGHKNVIRFDERPFADVEEMNKIMIENWNARVTNKDDVYYVGDFAYRSSEDPISYLKQLKGKKHLIVGNHDRDLLKSDKVSQYFESIEKIMNISDNGRYVVLCHYPMASWEKSAHGSWHVYAHIHNNIGYPTYDLMKTFDHALNAGCMINNYMPSTLDEMIVNNKFFHESNGYFNVSESNVGDKIYVVENGDIVEYNIDSIDYEKRMIIYNGNIAFPYQFGKSVFKDRKKAVSIIENK